jgi:hypothetical protein
MGDAEGRNNKPPGEQDVPPTASFIGAARGPGNQVVRFRIQGERGCCTVVVHWTDSSIRPIVVLP